MEFPGVLALKCTVVDLRAWDRQTYRQTDGRTDMDRRIPLQTDRNRGGAVLALSLIHISEPTRPY